jgi:hypothetical protein
MEAGIESPSVKFRRDYRFKPFLLSPTFFKLLSQSSGFPGSGSFARQKNCDEFVARTAHLGAHPQFRRKVSAEPQQMWMIAD